MKKIFAIILTSLLVVNTSYEAKNNILENDQLIIQGVKEKTTYDNEITTSQLKEIIVQNCLYTLDIAKKKQSLQETDNMYEEYTYKLLEESIKKADERLESITGKENELQMVECLNMQMDLTLCMSNLIIKNNK